MIRFSVLILMMAMLIGGCASSTFHRDSQGDVWKIVNWGNISAEYTKGETVIKTDSKFEFFKGILNINKVSAA